MISDILKHPNDNPRVKRKNETEDYQPLISDEAEFLDRKFFGYIRFWSEVNS